MSAAIDKAYARIEEGQLHLRCRTGADGASPLAMLHPSPSSSASLLPLMEELSGDLALYAFDSPCNGQSCAPLIDAPSIADFAAMIARGGDALGVERPALYGTHTGAHIAVEWAISRPGQVRALVIDGMALLDEETRAEFLEKYAPQKVPSETGEQFHWAWNFIRDQMLFFPHYNKDYSALRANGTLDPEILHTLVVEVLHQLKVYHLPYQAVFRHDAREALARISVPTLVLGDSESALDPATAEIADIVPGARLATDCATPKTKARAIENFLKELELG